MAKSLIFKLFEQNQTFFGDQIFQKFENQTFGSKKFDFRKSLIFKLFWPKSLILAQKSLIYQTFQFFNFFHEKVEKV